MVWVLLILVIVTGLFLIISSNGPFSSVMKSLDVNKVVGPDGMLSFISKHGCIQLAPSLATLFNKNMPHGKVPFKLKLVNFTPVLNKLISIICFP